MGPIGVWELLIILLILVIIFGASKLPELGRGLGQGISNFKKGLKAGPADETPEAEERENTSPS